MRKAIAVINVARLTIRLFGPFQVMLDGQSIHSFESDKARALLAYLAVEADRPHRREELAGMLWPDVPDSTARANLRRVLSNVRQVIGDRNGPGRQEDGGPFLQVTRQTIQFDAAQDAWLDVAEFKRGLMGQEGLSPAIHEIEEAVDVYRGPLLSGFSLPDSAPFEEWMRLSGEALQQQAAAALYQLARHYESAGEFAAGLPHARRLLQLEPYDEAGHRQVMRLLALSGQRGDALAHYEACRLILEQDLGVEPTAETTKLAEDIRSGDFSPRTPPIARKAIRGYELREHLGQGSYGSVYRAYQPVVGRDVAIKVVLPQLANRPDFIRRFEVEAQLAARLEHPHIVPLYDYWREPGGAYLVMRWLRAGSLGDALERGPWHIESAARLIDQIAAALYAAHRQGVVHRDIKPANILLDEANNAYLSDFGIAMILGPYGTTSEYSAHSPGEGLSSTPEYVSPEVLQDGLITPQADIYSLGVVLFELLIGKHPYTDLPQTALLDSHLNRPLPRVTELRSDLPAAVDDVLQVATAKDPAQRYSDTLALAEAFRQAIHPADEPDSLAVVVADEIPNPYQGLRPFSEVDAANFFGRESLTRSLVERLGGKNHFLAVIGPSGSGKSSVVRSGLIPALQKGSLPDSEKWFIARMTPGPQPLEALELALLRVAVNPPVSLLAQLQEDSRGLLRAVKRALPDEDSELLLFIDQFEELFTLADEETRSFFLESLAKAVSEPGTRLRLVVALRADFYDRPLQYSDFASLLRENQETVLPLQREELLQAINGPAVQAGLALEPELVAAMVADLDRQPGALPLLQYALMELVEGRNNNTLTLADYETMGGVAGALSRRAEALYAGLNRAQQEIVRQLFLRLVTLSGDGAPGGGETITRRRAPYSELLAIFGDEGDQAVEIMGQYGRYRLLTFDRDAATRAPTVEIAHEALLQAWPRLSRWLDDGRADLRQQRLLAAAAAEWQASSQDQGYLFRGARLKQFIKWADQTHLAITGTEATFLQASLTSQSEREAAEAARQAHEEALEARSRQRLQVLVAVLLAAVAVTAGLMIYAFNLNRIAQAQSRQATARELAAAAVSNIEVDPERSVLLATHAISQTLAAAETAVPEAVDALHKSLVQLRIMQVLSGTGDEACLGVFWCSDVAYSPDGRMMVTTGLDGGAILWDVETGRQILLLDGHAAPVVSVAFDSHGEYVATGGADGIAALWPVTDMLAQGETEVSTLPLAFAGHEGEVVDVAFSKDGTRLATASRDGTARIWDVATGDHLLTLTGHEGSVRGAVFAADDAFLITGSSDSTVRVWDLKSGEVAAELTGHSDRVFEIDLNPDETILASASRDGTVKEWDLVWEEGSVTAVERATLVNVDDHNGPVYAAAFSPDGSLLASGGSDATAQVWDVASGRHLITLAGHNGTLVNLAFSPDGNSLASGSLDGTVRTWDITPQGGREWMTLAGHQDVAFDVNYSPDGSQIATASFDGTASLWDASSGERLHVLETGKAPAAAAVFSPDGLHLATSSFNGTAAVWNADSGEKALMLEGHQGPVTDIVYSPDGHKLATASADGSVRLWDAKSGEELAVMNGHKGGVERVAFSPDGALLVSVGVLGTARIYDPVSGEQMGLLNAHQGPALGLAFNAAGDRLATTGGDRQIRLWDIANLQGEEGSVEPLMTLVGHQSDVWGAAFSPDGQTLATISFDGFVKLWDVSEDGEVPAENREIMSLGPENDGRELAFSPDGRFLAVTSGSGLLRIYLMQTDELLALAKERVTRTLTEAECSQYLHRRGC